MDFLQRKQLDLGMALRSATMLRDIMVQELRPRSEAEATQIVDGINQALSGLVSDTTRKGIAILIPVPAFEVTRPGQAGVFGDAILTVDVLENILINEGADGTGRSCEEIAALVLVTGHHYPLNSYSLLVGEKMEPIDVGENQDWSADVAIRVTFKIQGGFDPLPRCAIPQITVGGTVVIATTTPGATCLVTLDGSLPCSANPAAIPYDGPLSLPEPGTLVRACACKLGLDDSGANEVTIPA